MLSELFSIIMTVHSGNRYMLEAAQCSWLKKELVSPEQTYYVSDAPLPRSGGCGLEVKPAHVILEPFSTDLSAVFATVVQKSDAGRARPWILVVQPFTFVHPLHLCTYIASISPPGSLTNKARMTLNAVAALKMPLYVGRTRDASLELGYLALHPHVAADYGILLRSVAFQHIGRDNLNPFRVANQRDFHAPDAGEGDIGGVLYSTRTRTSATSRSDLFLATAQGFCPAADVTPREAAEAITWGPLASPEEMVALAQRLGLLPEENDDGVGQLASSEIRRWRGGLAEQRLGQVGLRGGGDEEPESRWEEGEKRMISKGKPRILFCVLAREDALGTIVKDTVETWMDGAMEQAHWPSVFFFVSQIAMDAQPDDKRKQLQRELAEVHQLLVSKRKKHASSSSSSSSSLSSQKQLPEHKVHHGYSAHRGHIKKRQHDKRRRRLALPTYALPGVLLPVDAEARSRSRSSMRGGGRLWFKRNSKTMMMTQLTNGTSKRTNGSWPKYGNFGPFYPAGDATSYSIANGDTPESIANVGPNLAPPVDSSDLEQQQVRLVRLKGLQQPPIRTYYQKKMVKPAIWNSWLRMKVKKLTLFLVEYLKPLRTPSKKIGDGSASLHSITVLNHYDWFVMLDDDTYIKVPQFTDVLTSLEPFPRSNAAAVGRKFIKVPTSHAARQTLSNTRATMPTMQMGDALRQDDNAAKRYASASAFDNDSTSFTDGSSGKVAINPGHSLLGGGPGIALSQRTLHAIRAAKCYNRIFSIISSTVPGGDGWLGQCLEFSKIMSTHDWRFKSLPPFAFSHATASHAVTFHKSHLREAHAVVQVMNKHDINSNAADSTITMMHSWTNLSNPTCDPVLLRDQQRVQCLPRFVIIGAQKSGTTSLFKYLGQHPQVSLPEEKEMNFFGTPWPASWKHPKMITLGQFTFDYLSRFGDKLVRPSWVWHSDGGGHNITSESGSGRGRGGAGASQQQLSQASSSGRGGGVNGRESSRSGMWKRPPQTITGEASPDYLVTGRHILQNLLRFAPRIKVIVSLRDPMERAMSAYANKVADGAVHRHLLRNLYAKRRVDKRSDATIAFASRLRLVRVDEEGRNATVAMIGQAAATVAGAAEGVNNSSSGVINVSTTMDPEQQIMMRRPFRCVDVSLDCVDSDVTPLRRSTSIAEKEHDARATNTTTITLQRIAALPEPWTVPTIQRLVKEDLNATLHACPDQTKHYTMAEVPAPKNDGGSSCYVNPFVLHGYYAKYLKYWAEVYSPLAVVSSGVASSSSGKGAGAGSQSHRYDHRHSLPSSSSSSSSSSSPSSLSWIEAEVRRAGLLVVDFEDLTHSDHRSAQTLEAVAAFLGLGPFNFRVGAVFNSRLNRGVHRGQVTGVAKDVVSKKLGSWLKDDTEAATNTGLDAAATQLLWSYYRRPNNELKALLGKELSWMALWDT